MTQYTVILSPSVTRTRVLVRYGVDELLRAYLPPPSRVRHERAMPTFLEGLAMLVDHNLRVVLSVAAQDARCCLGLTDELGLGHRSLFYDVEVVDRRVRRRRGSRIPGVGDVADLRQLHLAIEQGGLP